MTVSSIWTWRRPNGSVFQQIVEEWEDDLSAKWSLPLQNASGWERRAASPFGRLVRKMPEAINWVDDALRLHLGAPQQHSVAFLLWPPVTAHSYSVQSDVIPIVVDFWADQVRNAPRVFARSKLVVVTNKEAEIELGKTRLADKVGYVPLAISARHLCSTTPEKTLDLIQVGRQNPILHEWALRYVATKPASDYVYSKNTAGSAPQWVSVKQGPIGTGGSRERYFRLLRSARISLVSTPGIDGGEQRTGGYNPVTPRFYESAASRCHLMGRFPVDGEDVVENRVASVCHYVSSYETFSKHVEEALAHAPDLAVQDEFLADHTTARLANLIAGVLHERGFKINSELGA